MAGREGALVELDVFKVGEGVGVGFDDRVIRGRVILEFCVDLRRVMPQRQIALCMYRNVSEALTIPSPKPMFNIDFPGP